MELHYFTLKRQIEFLNEYVIGSLIDSCYSQRKNELILTLQLNNGTHKELLLSCHPQYPFIHLREISKRAKNSTDVLNELVGARIYEINIIKNDRVIRMEFSNRGIRFLLQFFRQNSNFFLVDKNNKIISAFKKQKKVQGNQYELKPPQAVDPNTLNENEFLSIVRKYPDSALNNLLKKQFLFFTGMILTELEVRCEFPLQNPVSSYSDLQLFKLYQEIIALFTAMQKDPPRIYFLRDEPRIFSLTELKSCRDYECRLYSDINEAWVSFIFGRLKYGRLEQKQDKIENNIRDRLDYLNTLISRLKQMHDESVEREQYQKAGELLLAQMYSLPENTSMVEITDLYHPQQPKIKVKLNPELSIRENAQAYFEKAKSVAAKHREIKKRLAALEKDRKEIEVMLKKILRESNISNLTRMEHQLVEMHVIRTDIDTLEEVHLPFKRFYFEGWEIRVGKNARSNDELTFRHSRKEDFWLHAQGSGGSHVVIRNPQRKENPPRTVLTYAGTLAARNSKAKHSNIVPVIYTKIKYVRKIKGSPPGTVNTERIKTIFVELKQ
jgi:predicted ribosome quality control (RQC) complex YloA/Tae2 family protein